MNSYGYVWRILTIILAITYPFFCVLIAGYKPSLSQYWNTTLQPIFILSNILTVYYFIQIKNWRIPAIFLFLLTIFSISFYGNLHNIFAICFFISAFIPLCKTKRFTYTFYIYLLGGCLIPFNLLVGEIIIISTIGLYHFLLLTKLKKIKKTK